MKAFFTATATGILLFLLWDVLSAAVDPVEAALRGRRRRRFAGLAALLTVGFAAGLLSLVGYDAWMKRQRARRMLGPGAASTAEFERGSASGALARRSSSRFFIATGIGLHNFSEGLAIGQSAARDEIALASS